MTHAIVFVVLCIIPVLTYFDVRKMKANPENERLKLWQYLKIIVVYSILTAGIVNVMSWDQLINPSFRIEFWGSTILHISISIFFLWGQLGFLVLLRNQEFKANFIIQLAKHRYMFPESTALKSVVFFAAIVIGFFEEVMFRAFLPTYVTELLEISPLLAVIIANVLFGIVHYHQGSTGVIETAKSGFIWSFLYYSTGTLWVPIILHAVADMKLIFFGSILRQEGHRRVSED